MTHIENIALNPEKKIYFVSDFHLGAPTEPESRLREKRIVQWLDEISKDAQTIFLLGDIFDFWFEYKQVVPKGYTRLLGKLAEMTDNGIDLRMFVGNHDLWTFGYLEKEIGIQIYHKPQLFKINESLCFIGHGDGLGYDNLYYKIIGKIFRNRFFQRLFAGLHPWIGTGLAIFCSRKSRAQTGKNDAAYTSDEKESLLVFSKEYLKKNPDVKYFIFGHRHLPQEFEISETSTYFNTGDWLNYNSYLEFEHEKIKLKKS